MFNKSVKGSDEFLPAATALNLTDLAGKVLLVTLADTGMVRVDNIT